MLGWKPASSRKAEKHPADIPTLPMSRRQKLLLQFHASLDTLELKDHALFLSWVFSLSTGQLLCLLTYHSLNTCLQRALGLKVCARAEPCHNNKQVSPVHNLGFRMWSNVLQQRRYDNMVLKWLWLKLWHLLRPYVRFLFPKGIICKHWRAT